MMLISVENNVIDADAIEPDHLRELMDRGWTAARLTNFIELYGWSLPEMNANLGHYQDYSTAELNLNGSDALNHELLQLRTITPDSIERKPKEWLWEGIIQKRKLNFIQGIPHVGKTFLLCALASAVSCGGLVQGINGSMEKLKQGKVLLFEGDDDLDEIADRLDMFDHEPKNIHIVPFEEHPTPIGSPEFEYLVHSTKPDLIIIDTLAHYLSTRVDLNNYTEATTLFKPLRLLAEEYNAAALTVMHVSKHSASNNGGFAVHAAIGSTGISGVARTLHTLGRIYDESGKATPLRVLAPVKTSAKSDEQSANICFELSDRGFLWAGIDTEITAENLLTPPKRKNNFANAPARSGCEEFLMTLLSSGSVPATMATEAAQAQGYSVTTIKRARKSLGIISSRDHSKKSAWLWSLPEGHHISSGDLLSEVPAITGFLTEGHQVSDGDPLEHQAVSTQVQKGRI
ncbi:MAG: AAA family ATPase [Oscillospiraceae bacterium]|nr:AAA family ATPase [Oscillospiraceae bacterium]